MVMIKLRYEEVGRIVGVCPLSLPIRETEL